MAKLTEFSIRAITLQTKNQMAEYIFEYEFEVRDYECDAQGIVNNANYQHYMEHTRHRYIQTLGLDFMQLTNAGVILVVAKAELQYKKPLVSNDKFVCRLNVKKEGIRYVFTEDIYRLSDNQLCTKGKFDIVSVINGRLGVSAEVDKALFGE